VAATASRELRWVSTGDPSGIPVAIKDLIDVKGYRTTSGAHPLPSSAATEDAVVVESLQAPGHLLGETALHAGPGRRLNRAHFG
jgi:aspartyl-tRNA(Asn)/glutamyl-tRNA(Gln) amidotransferase subunit A